MKALTQQKLLTIVGMVVGLFIARAQPGMPLWTTLAMIGVLVIIPVFAILISSKYSSHIIKFGVLILGGGLVVSLLLILFDGIPNVGWGAIDQCDLADCRIDPLWYHLQWSGLLHVREIL